MRFSVEKSIREEREREITAWVHLSRCSYGLLPRKEVTMRCRKIASSWDHFQAENERDERYYDEQEACFWRRKGIQLHSWFLSRVERDSWWDSHHFILLHILLFCFAILCIESCFLENKKMLVMKLVVFMFMISLKMGRDHRSHEWPTHMLSLVTHFPFFYEYLFPALSSPNFTLTWHCRSISLLSLLHLCSFFRCKGSVQ